MSKMIFRGVEWRHSDRVAPKEGAVFERAHFRCDLTNEVIEEMGWEELPNCVASPAKLPGELAANSLTITPNDSKLSQHERCLSIDVVDDFRAVPLKDDDKEVHGHCLEFAVKITHVDSILAFTSISIPLSRMVCRLEASYEKRQQQSLEGVEDGGDDERQMTLGQAEETEEPGGDRIGAIIDSDSGSAVRAAIGEVVDEISEYAATTSQTAVLATAREAAGGTHAKGRRARKAVDLPSAPGDGEGSGDGILKAIQGGGKDEPWSGTITVLDRDGVLSWVVAVKIHGGPMAEADCKGEPPLSIPAAASEAAEFVAEWADSQLSTGERDIKLAAAQIRSWALNTKADNRVSAPAESSIRVARGGR